MADDVWFQKRFTDSDYLDWFSRHERFCELRYLLTLVQIHLPWLLQIYLNSNQGRLMARRNLMISISRYFESRKTFLRGVNCCLCLASQF